MEENYINTNSDEPIEFPTLTSFTYQDKDGNQLFGHYAEDGNSVIDATYEYVEPNVTKLLFSSSTPNSEIRFSDIIVETKHHFNWLQKKMWKIFFGADITTL
jgi:hypothetical protein